jgi:hypothetical protein
MGNRSEGALLFSESNSGRIVEGTLEDREPFECGPDGADFACVGKVTDEQVLIVRRMESKVAVKEDLFG